MILRVVHGRVAAGRLDEVRASLERDYVPAAERRRGLDRYLVAARATDDGHELALITAWADIDSALAAFDGNLGAIRTIDDATHGATLDAVDYFEVDIGEMRRAAGTPRYLRLSAGSVGRGLDADIQRDLRDRLRALDRLVVDAWIGRRVKGALVEIAFASSWSAVPPDRSLTEPIWPDLSATFDAFGIRAYDVLIAGTPTR